ncbi:hypothetical protein Acsp04_15890 [Actinomadura sp. NBRC 104425]|nr:hypothetical protein Acsp04_15890 [Actinomadura sp. NBRC 104425]
MRQGHRAQALPGSAEAATAAAPATRRVGSPCAGVAVHAPGGAEARPSAGGLPHAGGSAARGCRALGLPGSVAIAAAAALAGLGAGSPHVDGAMLAPGGAWTGLSAGCPPADPS